MNKAQIPFVTIREDFSTFECENGQTLRVKLPIVEIIKIQDGDKENSAISFNEISHVFSSTPIDTSNLEMARSEDVTAENQVKELEFKMTNQTINLYETEKSLIVLVPVVEKIFITDKKDKDNNPILRYVMKNSVSIISKKTLSEGVPNLASNSTPSPIAR